MTIFGKAGAALALTAMTLGAVPAEAQRHGRHRSGHDRIDGGDVLLGAVLAGGLFALLSSKKKTPPPPSEEVAIVDDGAAAVTDAPPPDVGPNGENRTISIARTDEEAAVDACVSSAESEGRRYARIAKIDKVTIVDAVASDWIVRGSLALRDDYRAPATEYRGFSCRVGERGVEQVSIEGARIAAN
jgi:hypothetical protein